MFLRRYSFRVSVCSADRWCPIPSCPRGAAERAEERKDSVAREADRRGASGGAGARGVASRAVAPARACGSHRELKTTRPPPRGTQHWKFDSSFLLYRFLSNIDCIILISARCVLSASVAKLKMSASWPAPAVLNKSLTIVNAPLWC